MTLTEKVAYIKGIAEGANLDKNTPEGKILDALIDLVNDMALEVEDLEEDADYFDEYIDELDHDLGATEQFLIDTMDYEIGMYDDDEDYDEDYDDEYDGEECDGDCANCGEDCDFADDDEDYFEVVCPSCGATVCFDSELAADQLKCPACGEKFECIVDEDDYKEIKGDKEDK